MAKSPTNEEWKQLAPHFIPAFSRFDITSSPDEPHLLAHYTSVEVVESILKNEEIWFSNPLYMNDLEEMQAGLDVADALFPEYALNAAPNQRQQVERLVAAFNHFMVHLKTEVVPNTYVFCLSKHEHGDTDGLLSMWREYGRKGNGVALVFNTQKIHYQSHSPLILAKVDYASPQQRESAVRDTLEEWASITRGLNLPDQSLHLASYAALLLMSMQALVTKHRGFGEEKEWRVLYLPLNDSAGYLKPCLDYHIGPRGVEPKLKYKLGPTLRPDSGSGPDLTTGSLPNIVELIMLGPTISSPLARSAFVRMLQRIDMGELEDRVFPSTIPLRPQA